MRMTATLGLSRLFALVFLWAGGCRGFVSQERATWSPPLFFRRQHAAAALESPLISLQLQQDGSAVENSSSVQVQGLSELKEAFENASGRFRDLSVQEIQKALVRTGVAFAETSLMSDNDDSNDADTKDESGVLLSPFEKVSGCIANVHVRTRLVPQTENENESATSCLSYRVQLQGTTDALLSRGLLAVLALAVQDASTDAILALESDQVADELGIRPALSLGRNDGLASMLRTIQRQVRNLLVLASSVNNDEQAFAASLLDQSPSAATSTNNDSSGKPTVALLLSGGVDSSVALNLLKRQNYAVTAFYLKIWLEDELAHLGQCPWEDDYRVCQEVCKQAGVPLETISLQDAYKERVISYTVREAEHGRTPNPDIMCNSRIKFGCFYDAIASREFEYVATGHYAQLVNGTDAGTGMRLLRAPDPVKDQSYFLCALTQEQLQRVLFPIGHMQKSQVRALADEFELPNRHRPDSQGLCFLGKVKFEEFLGAYLGERPGKIIDAGTGDVIGRHKGVWYHTVGQRKGIGKVLDPLATSKGPWYVVAKDPENDIVFCSNRYDEDIFTAARSSFAVETIQWTAGSPPESLMHDTSPHRFKMKIRHGPRLVDGTLTLTDANGLEGDVQLDAKDSGLAPGQYVVFYEGEECLGGGVISERHWAKFLLDRDEWSLKVSLEQNLTVS